MPPRRLILLLHVVSGLSRTRLFQQPDGRSRWIKDDVATALESRKKVIPVLLDAGARDNWVWPLLADRQARTVNSDADLHRLATDIQRSITVIVVAIVAALLGAFLTFVLTR